MSSSSKISLTPMAIAHLRSARAWSRKRWGRELTARYFHDIDRVLQELLANPDAHHSREELAGNTSLKLYPVREHYLVYEPQKNGGIIVVAFIRQGRDIPAILSMGYNTLERELRALREKLK